jgi:hypothetical protein
MMQFMRILCGMLFAALMTACGGGGGSAGAVPGAVTPPAAKPTVSVDIITTSGAVTSTVNSATTTFARATVLDALGAKVQGTVVTFSTSSGLAAFSPSNGTALTNADGVATVQILPASSTSGGAGVLNANASVGGVAATQGQYSYQVPQGTPDTPTARVADFALLLDRSTLSNGGTSTAKLTVVTVDSSNNVVAGAAVAVATDARSIFTPGGTVTDAQGQYTGQIGIGTDKSDRQITATVTVNGMTKKTTLRVIGSKITLQATPSAPMPGQAVALTATLVDSAGNPIPSSSIRFGGTIASLQNVTTTTDLSGVATQAFIAPSTAGVYTITATGSGVVSSEYQLQVFTSAVPAAVIPAGASPSLSPNPTVLAVNSPGTTSSRATLRFLFLDGSNKPVQNVRVRFVDTTTGLAAVGASISSGTSLLYTDASGTATAEYIAGQNSSPTNGVTIKACYSATDFATTACPASVTASLTVAGQALAVSIGDDNLLAKGSGTYIKRFAVTVADSAGRAVANAPVDISVDLTHYGKGAFEYNYISGGTAVFALSVVPPGYLDAYPSDSTVPSALDGRVWCANEDHNRNGSVDPGENINGSKDSNNQDTLEPRKCDLIVSYDSPTVTTTNSSGILVIKVEYSQRFATWLAYKVRVTASVAGSQGMAERLFVTNFVEGDDKNGSFLEPPYGFSSCTSPL